MDVHGEAYQDYLLGCLMAKIVDVEVEGAEQVIADLKGLGNDLKDIPMEEVSTMYVKVTSALAPKRTGRLANSIRPANGKNEAGAMALAPYAHIVNYGSVYMKPTYFMNRADDMLKGKTLASVEESVDNLIENRGLDA